MLIESILKIWLNALFHVIFVEWFTFGFKIYLFNRVSIEVLLLINWGSQGIIHQTVFILCTTTVSEWILDIRLNRREGFLKFCEAELGITIEVEPSHNSGQFCFKWLVPDAFKEASNWDFIDDFMILEVNCFKSPSNAETVEFL